jgi:hypothetical protein
MASLARKANQKIRGTPAAKKRAAAAALARWGPKSKRKK